MTPQLNGGNFLLKGSGLPAQNRAERRALHRSLLAGLKRIGEVMINPFQEVNWRPDTTERRKFALSLVIGFPCVALLLFVAARLARGVWNPVPPLWIGGFGLSLGLLLWGLPGMARPFYVVWYALACCMGLVIGNLLLITFFYGVMTPIGWSLRIAGRKLVRKGFCRSSSTYWQDAGKVTDPRRYYRQY